MRTLLCSMVIFVGACAAPTTEMVALDPAAATSQAEGGGIRVGLVSVYDNVVSCEVVNLGKEAVVVDRDAVVMVTPVGERRVREDGGLVSTYGIPGGGSHVVNLRFNLDGVLDQDVVKLDFSHAVLRDGKPIPGLAVLRIQPKQQTL